MIADLDLTLREARAALDDAIADREQAQLHMGYCDLQVSNARADVIAIERTRALAGAHARAREAVTEDTRAAMDDGLAAARAALAGDDDGDSG